MTHADDFSAAAASHLAYFGEAGRVAYRNVGEVTAVDLDTAIVGKETIEEVGEPNRRLKRRRRTITIGRSELDAVRLAAVLVVDGEDWSIDEIASQTADLIVVRISRPETTERSRPGYRGDRAFRGGD